MVLDVVRILRPHPSVKPGAKVDARSERWREHRKKVRGEIVEAAFRAIDRLGPETECAGNRRRGRHRQAEDLPALPRQVRPVPGDRGTSARHVVGGDLPVDRPEDRLGPRGDPAQSSRSTSTSSTAPQRTAGLHSGALRGHPAIDRPILNEGREITLAMADLFDTELREMELDHAAMELAAHAAFGSAASATDWWLGPDPTARGECRATVRRAPTTIMMGVIVGTAEVLGIAMDPDRPIHDGAQQARCELSNRDVDIAAAIDNTRAIRYPGYWVFAPAGCLTAEHAS